MKASANPSERRRVPRISVDFPVTITCKGKQYRWQASEFSEFGILLDSKQKGLVGEDVEVELKLNAADPALSLNGIVVYAKNAGIAVRFKNVSFDEHRQLKSYIEATKLKQ